MTLHAPLMRRLAALLVLTCAAALIVTALPARAAASGGGTSACDGQIHEQPFLPWADPAQYVLVPGGSFGSGGDGWTLSGSRVISADEPWNVSGDATPGALELPAGAGAVSAPLCVTLLHPTLRFFARGSAGYSRLDVEVLYDLDGSRRSLALGTISGDGEWAPTLPLAVLANLLADRHGFVNQVSFRFTARSGAWLVDDVYVDPYRKG